VAPVVKHAALQTTFSPVLRFSSASIIPPTLHILSSIPDAI
jgi:hypothetical protein